MSTLRAKRERARLSLAPHEEEEEEEAVFISVVNTNEDPPNAHKAFFRSTSGSRLPGLQGLTVKLIYML